LKDQLERVKRAEAAKTNFLANMSHEMRTPLNAILGGIELLDSTSLKKQQQEFIRVSQTAGKSLKRVIDDVLDMARIEAGGVEIKPNWFISTALIDDVVSLFTHDARQAETSIELI
jgi:signal transduction histidine kinase